MRCLLVRQDTAIKKPGLYPGFFWVFDTAAGVVVSNKASWVLSGLCLLAVSLGITFTGAKDLTVDAWMYHYYSGSQLFDNRISLDYFAASAQGYFNPLAHVLFAAMVRLDWPDIVIASVLTVFCCIAFMLLLLFYKRVLSLQGKALWVALLLSLLSGVVWCGVGTSTADLYIQSVTLVALYCLFRGRDGQHSRFLYWSGLCWGVAAGMKLSALIYAPAVALLLFYWVLTGRHRARVLVIMPSMAVLGFLLSFGWWGRQLFEQFGNPFFPHFNAWFQSPDYTSQPLSDGRFLAIDTVRQLWLPFRIALSEPFIYLEIVAPDLKPAVFVLAALVMLLRLMWLRVEIGAREEFVMFVFVSLFVWVFISGNGRYAILLFLLMGAAIHLLFVEILPKKIAFVALGVVVLLQAIVVASVSNFSFSAKPWGATWYNATLQHHFNDQLVLKSTGNPMSAILVRAMGEGSSLSAPNTSYRMDINDSFRKLLARYDGRTVGVFPLPGIIDAAAMHSEQNRPLLERLVYEEFGRFGLAYDAKQSCQVVNVLDDAGRVASELLVCHLSRDDEARALYLAETAGARQYLARMEQACGKLLTPTDNALSIHDGVIEKYYRGSEIQVFYQKNRVLAKKYWSMRYFEMGDMASFDVLGDAAWRERFCLPLARATALPAGT